MSQPGFFDVDRRLAAISAKGDPLETIDAVVPWESFRAPIEAVTATRPEDRKSNAGRPGYDTLLKCGSARSTDPPSAPNRPPQVCSTAAANALKRR